jgi:Arc/MetJ-type ribon-helix-helix transcriptional regulator
MSDMRKITVEVPEELIASVQASAGMGLTETIREALEQMRQRQVQNEVRKLRGKVKFSMTLDELRYDRE